MRSAIPRPFESNAVRTSLPARWISHLLILVTAAALALPAFPPARAADTAATPPATIWTVPEIATLPDNELGRLTRRGRDLITATYAHIGPEVLNAASRYAGNNLACGNCHLEAGTKKFGITLFGLFGEYPRYNARSGQEITIEGRVDGCMMRSMNGRAMPLQAPQMQAIVAYIAFLSTGVPPGEALPGLGVGKMPELNRAADPAGAPDLRARVHGVPWRGWAGRASQPSHRRPRLLDAAALGAGQL